MWVQWCQVDPACPQPISSPCWLCTGSCDASHPLPLLPRPLHGGLRMLLLLLSLLSPSQFSAHEKGLPDRLTGHESAYLHLWAPGIFTGVQPTPLPALGTSEAASMGDAGHPPTQAGR